MLSIVSQIKYLLDKRRLSAELERAYKADIQLIAKAKKDGLSGSNLADYKQQLAHENWILEDEMAQLKSRHLCRRAYRHDIPIPPHGDPEMWEQLTCH